MPFLDAELLRCAIEEHLRCAWSKGIGTRMPLDDYVSEFAQNFKTMNQLEDLPAELVALEFSCRHQHRVLSDHPISARYPPIRIRGRHSLALPIQSKRLRS